MPIPRRYLVLVTALSFLILGLGLWQAHRHFNAARQPDSPPGALPFRMSDRMASIRIDGPPEAPRFRFDDAPDAPSLSAAEFAAALRAEHERKQAGGWIFRVLDITSLGGLLWVLPGLAGQTLFTGRMVVQWIASERAGKSIIPTAFWWMSLCGSSLLIIYFAWRVDIVGILGQATGWFVYIRNLLLLRKAANEEAAGGADPERRSPDR